MKIKDWSLTEAGAIWISVILTVIVLLESKFPIWAPFFILYAVLAIVIPIYLKTYRFGSFAQTLKDCWKVTLLILVLAVFFDQVVFSWLSQWILDTLGVGASPFYSLNAAFATMIAAIAQKFAISTDAAQMLFAFFLIIWAPIGEELFYRGYLQGVLRKNGSFRFAAIISALFFGFRHATHFFLLWPAFPWVAAASWVVSAFVFGLFMSYLYEKTRSLYPPMLVHLGVNLIELLFL